MVVKKSNIIGIALMLSLALAPYAAANDNSIVQLDLKKSSNNAVDLTFFTTTQYQDNIIVRKKSDNKYVVLMPKVLTSNNSSPDLSGVKDLVSHIDVKSINESGNAYTKVTLITTKPLEIKTHSQKSAPASAEQQEYKTLIAKANAIKHNPSKNNTAESPKVTPVVNKQETKTTEVKPKDLKINQAEQKPKNNNKINQITDKIQSQTKEIKDSITNKAAESKKDELSKNVPDIIPANEPVKVENAPKQEASNIPPVAVKNVSLVSKLKTKTISTIKEVKHKMPVNIPTALAFILIPLLGIYTVIKLIKASLIKSNVLKESFINNLAEKPVKLDTLKYNNIVNNEELTWQQKYQKYLDATAQPVSRGDKKGNYTFIKQPAPIEEKRQSLEQMFTEMAEAQEDSIMPEIVEIHNEEDKIKEELHNTVKFKSFAQNNAMTNDLNMSRRNKVKSRFKKYDIPKAKKVQKNVDLGNSLLHSNPRKLENAELNVSDIKGKGIEVDPNDYVMSSVEEFFSLLDKEQQAKEEAAKITNPVASSLSQIKPSIKMKKEPASPASKSMTTNPIVKLRAETKDSYLNGLIVKSGFNIDENKGFYVVSLDGTSALIGRIKDEVFVLKKFDNTIDKPLQVRHDKDNVYMVKAADFKSLVEVNEDKMGVLIEL